MCSKSRSNASNFSPNGDQCKAAAQNAGNHTSRTQKGNDNLGLTGPEDVLQIRSGFVVSGRRWGRCIIHLFEVVLDQFGRSVDNEIDFLFGDVVGGGQYDVIPVLSISCASSGIDEDAVIFLQACELVSSNSTRFQQE